MQARSDEGDSRRAAHTGGGNGNKEAGRARKLWGKGGGGLTVSRLQDDVAKTLVAMVELPDPHQNSNPHTSTPTLMGAWRSLYIRPGFT